MKKQKVATDEDFDHVPSSSVGKLEQVAPPTASTTAGAAPNLFYTSEFSTFDYGCWLERMGLTGESSIPEDSMDYIDLYLNHDPSLDLQTNCLMPFERDYILQLVAVILATLTKTRANMVTPTLRALVILSWQSLCRLGMKLPLLEKLVATSQKPTALFEAHCSVQEAVKLWEASSDDLRRLRTILASKVE
ncbi:hypothetical protein TIFTF001_015861 [Ficus carica]|uniref:Uncharacterized protein n=1 Tax=Ficus carica TaxID=3494 RepID=A0AA88D5K4_FICCA|nr:hypothetical protein TIFTF001_015861 [Ficus carica]